MKHLTKAILFATIGLLAISCAASEEASVYADQITYDLYFDSFSSHFEPATTLDELAARSDNVITGTLIDVVDGPVFGDATDDPNATRHVVLVFESDSVNGLTQTRVMLPRPNTSVIETLRPVMPIGAHAALYLSEFPQVPETESQYWHQLERPLWQPTTAQGIIWERTPHDTTSIEVPISGGSDFPFQDAPPDNSDISAWLPPNN